MPNQVIFMDSFEHMATLADLRRKWTMAVGSIYATGRNGKCASIGNGSLLKSFPQQYSTLYAGVAYKTEGFSNAPITINNLFGNTVRVLHIGDGRFRINSYDNFGRHVNSDPLPNVIYTNVWYYLEFGVELGSDSLSYEFRINEEVIDTGSLSFSYSRPNYTANIVTFAGSGAGYTTYVDDIYIATDRFYGDVIIDYIKPNGNTAYSQWTPSSEGVDHWDLVNDLVPNDDVDYVESNTATQEDRYEMEDVGTIGEIFAIQGVCYVKKVDPGTGKLTFLYEVSGSTAESDTFYPSANDYQYFLDVQNESPGGGNWVGSLVNALKYGIRRIL